MWSKFKLSPVLALLAACGETETSPVPNYPRYNLPAIVHQLTLERSSVASADGFDLFAIENHRYGSHQYIIMALPAQTLNYVVKLTATPTSATHLLTDLTITEQLDFPAGDSSYGQLYSLLLAEQKDSLDGLKSDSRALDYLLRIMERK
ncbi:MAG TPA: hypothetical protein VJH68_05755 [Candidatus Nanoarchaeia archaeon]|nr:hypothetical protein [Candidatus Nanoarchaeia archaeon]